MTVLSISAFWRWQRTTWQTPYTSIGLTEVFAVTAEKVPFICSQKYQVDRQTPQPMTFWQTAALTRCQHVQRYVLLKTMRNTSYTVKSSDESQYDRRHISVSNAAAGNGRSVGKEHEDAGTPCWPMPGERNRQRSAEQKWTDDETR